MSFCYMRLLFCELCSKGLGSQSKPTEILTSEDEEKLWATGLLTPKSLLNAVIFYTNKNFLLCDEAEHREFKFSQLKRSVNGNG